MAAPISAAAHSVKKAPSAAAKAARKAPGRVKALYSHFFFSIHTTAAPVSAAAMAITPQKP